MKKVIVIGGNGAGMSAASQVKRQEPQYQVIVFEKGSYISYAACGIPYYIQGVVEDINDLIILTPEEALEKRGLDVRMQCEVVKIDPEKRSVHIESPEGGYKEDFDYLVIATGALPLNTGIRYVPSPRIFHLTSLAEGQELKKLIAEKNIKKCAVIGAGYIGIEVLEAFKERALETHLIHRSDTLAKSFEPEISAIVFEEMEKEGVILKLNHNVEALSEEDDIINVHTDKGVLSYDLVVLGTGVVPNNQLALKSGISTGIKGAVRVNEYMQTIDYTYIYAVGDCVETRNLLTGEPVHIALALKANKEGVIAGNHICGGKEKFPGVLGAAITKFCNLGIARTGLTYYEAEKNRFEPLKMSFKAKSKAHYYPGSGTLNTVLIVAKNEGRILGAQITGPVDSVKRIDVYTTAITAGFTLNDIYNLDIAYAPPFSPVYDPIVLSGRVGRKKIDKSVK